MAEVDFSASLLVQAEEDYQRALRRQNSILYKSFHSMVVHYTNTVNAIVKIMQDVLGMFFKHSNRYWLRYKMSAN
ncbi:hypothetical protein EON65_29990 [archaeon]|nr:MAG: hypothetical protein EON65_29990 [archaeon]